MTVRKITYTKCRCGDPVCKQYTLDCQGSVGFELADAKLFSASPQMLVELKAVRPYAPWPLMQRIDAVIAEVEGKAS